MSLNYKGQNLFIDSISIKGIANKNITPFYVYSYKKIKDNFETFCNYFKKVSPLVCFSVKSNSNVSILTELGKLGSGADVVSCLLYTSPSPRDATLSRMPSSA